MEYYKVNLSYQSGSEGQEVQSGSSFHNRAGFSGRQVHHCVLMAHHFNYSLLLCMLWEFLINHGHKQPS
jgi:hypothetical protein